MSTATFENHTPSTRNPLTTLNVLMVYPLPSPVSPQQNPSLSIIYPGRAAEDAGHTVEFWDARHDRKERQLWKLAEEADVIAVSSLSGFQLGESMRIAQECRARWPEKPIVWGGVHVTFQPLASLREPFVDFVVLGEGEDRFPKLLAAIATGAGFKDIDGIGYKRTSVGYQPSPEEDAAFKEEGLPIAGVHLRPVSGAMKEIIEIHDAHGSYDDCTIVVHRRGLTVNLKTNYIHAVSPKTKYLFEAAAKRNEVILQTSRGCNWSPTSCEFCSVAGQFTQWSNGKVSSVYRYIPFEEWSVDLIAIHELHPFTFIELEDENSSHFQRDWRYAELLKKLGITYHLHLRSDQLQDEATIARLAETGCVKIHIGAESGNEETLAMMRKHEKVEDHYKAARMLAKHGIQGIYTWIIGNPGETPAQVMDTLRVSDEIRALHPPGMSRATIYVLMPLPGTVAFSRAEKEGWPLPKHMAGWTEMSAAYNPNVPEWMNSLYIIAGFHHNRFHKTAQNFPGWWRLLILPFELLIEERWKQGIKTANPFWFKYFAFEYWCIMQLVKWRSKQSVGQGKNQLPKLLERLMPGLAGH